MSGSPHGVFGGVHVFGGAFVCPVRASGANATTTASTRVMKRQNDFICGLLDYVSNYCFFLNCPYNSSSANGTHLNSSNCAFFSTWRYKVMLIFHGRVNTLGSSMVASYWR